MALVTRFAGSGRQAAEFAVAAWPMFLRPLAIELASHRPIRELLPGVHHWTRIHPRIKLPVDSYYIESAGAVLDPLTPREAPDDTALHIRTAGGGALAFADGLTRPRGGGLRFVPGFRMGDDAAAVRAGLRESLRRLLDLDFDHLLFAHGNPLVGGGKAALREFAGGEL